jgi:transposase
MMNLTSGSQIFICTESIDFRKGIDGLAGICKYELNQDPFSGAMFVFTNQGKKALKILFYDGQGYWVYHKRLSRGKFNWWPQGELCQKLAVKDLTVLIWNGDPNSSRMQPDWISCRAQ